ncbi:AT-hook motif nuclear-localized protein 9-like [Zingiber officinale]|uniref:AT-hook motif nuclear-localized protein 9-like n=1 Tax=Zingiber officinale TaxID=94328 RepID=UPI001C4DBFB9|nr:AT-hook motif nuclear-localized protein 9-like [Zingiber officinale]XP_042376375.1 AT-hook motif nuclear-localized protein 9-like [Zingiber officinale]
MDGRDAMAMSGAASYYIAHRGIPGSQSGLHLTAQPGGRSISNLGTSLIAPPSSIGAAAFQVESPSAVSSQGVVRLGEGVSQAEPVKRKRGRPRKYGPDGSVALALSPISSSAPSGFAIGSRSASESGAPTQKRGRGRPPGTGRKQLLASFGEWVAGSAGMGFTPHVITIAVGEDIATKIMSFSQQGPRAVCILSANGVVSSVTLRQSATSGGVATYEGRFEILGLSGSYMTTDNGESRGRTGGLSISLSSPDGRVIGGGVAGVLKAATPVQVIVGSFIYTGFKAKNKAKVSIKTNHPEAALQFGDEQTTPFAAPPNANLTSPIIAGWPGSRQLDMRNAHIDIDLMRG